MSGVSVPWNASDEDQRFDPLSHFVRLGGVNGEVSFTNIVFSLRQSRRRGPSRVVSYR